MDTRFRFKIITALISISLIGLLLGQGYWLKGLYSSSRKNMMNNFEESMRMADYKELFARMDSLNKSDRHEKVEYQISPKQDTSKQTDFAEDITYKDQQETLHDFLLMLENMETKIQGVMHLKIDSMMPVDYSLYDSILTSELKERDIPVLYKLQVIQQGISDSIRYVSTGTIHGSLQNAVQVTYPIGFGNTYYNLLLQSPDRVVFRQMAGVLISSSLLVIIILTAFIYLLNTILRQKTIEELKTDFTNNMTHELKTPISVAYAANDVLLNYSDTVNDKQRKYLNIVREQLTHLTGLVEQILTLSVENRSTFRLTPEPVRMAELLPTLIEQHKLKTSKPLTIKTEVPDCMIISADRTHLYNMVSNLIENAIKYSGEKPCQMQVKAVQVQEEIRLSVTDNGIGISEANQKHLFDKFFRVPSGNLHNVKGYGLGLYYVSNLMARHNGYVTVKSQLGKGSTFTLHFKIQHDE